MVKHLLNTYSSLQPSWSSASLFRRREALGGAPPIIGVAGIVRLANTMLIREMQTMRPMKKMPMLGAQDKGGQ